MVAQSDHSVGQAAVVVFDHGVGQQGVDQPPHADNRQRNVADQDELQDRADMQGFDLILDANQLGGSR